MGDVAISIQSIGKRYSKGEGVRHKDSFKEAVLRKLAVWLPGIGKYRSLDDAFFWALKDICLDVKKGQILGIIGANGSGKSTLLKILARITRPTTGRVEIFGQVGSLHEVGTGFHPELTGRENVYLNGTILGMKKKEIDKKFDAIVQFSGVEEFLDTPVKRYSSGMQVRLAFSVAAHFEPEILLLDEVLAVGDASFLKKSKAQMESVARAGRTVVFVSHDMESVKDLCAVTVLLDHGEMIYAGPTEDTIERYLHRYRNSQAHSPNQQSIQGVQIVGLRAIVNGHESSYLPPAATFAAEMDVRTEVYLPEVDLGLMIEDATGMIIAHHRTDFAHVKPALEPGVYHVKAVVPKLDLRAGPYKLWTRVNLVSKGSPQWVDSAKLPLEVAGGTEGTGLLEISCQWTWHKAR